MSWSLIGCIHMPVFTQETYFVPAVCQVQHNIINLYQTSCIQVCCQKNVPGQVSLNFLSKVNFFFYYICYLEQIDHLQESVFLSKVEGNNIINICFSKEKIIYLNLCTKKTVIFYCAKMLKWFKIKTISPFPDFSLVYFGFKNIMCSFLSNNFYFLLVGLSDKLIWYGISPG